MSVRAWRRAAALASAIALPTVAFAQGAPPPEVRDVRTIVRSLAPLLNTLPSPETWRTQRPVPPLEVRVMERMRRAGDLRNAGLVAQARDSLLEIERIAPMQPMLETELARTEMALGQPAAAVDRLRRLRSATRDTVVGAHDLALALERLGRPREAAKTAVDSWSVARIEGPWALTLVLRLAPLDARGIAEIMRSAAQAQPSRTDLLLGSALLLARQGQAAEAIQRLTAADAATRSTSLRMAFADELTMGGTRADSLAAAEALVGIAGASAAEAEVRLSSARRALDLAPEPAARAALAPRLALALTDVPFASWGQELTLDLARELRRSGRAAEARTLLARAASLPGAPPDLELERLLAVLRDGPPARALPGLDSLAKIWNGALFMRAEALFFAGELDSAAAAYARAAKDASSENAMAALERAYQLEDDPGSSALRALGAAAYARWRGDTVRARALAESLWIATVRSSPSWSHTALLSAEICAEARDWRAALVPLLAVADSLPEDRLAPLARERAGDAFLALGDARAARAQFEECLARYPRAWNAAEVRRRLEPLRKSRP